MESSAILFEWLTRRLNDGCTDTSIFRGRDFWQITFRNAGIPSSDPLGTQRYKGKSLAEALSKAKQADSDKTQRGLK